MQIGIHVVIVDDQRQDIVSCSSAAAECHALSQAAKEMVWLIKLLNDLKV